MLCSPHRRVPHLTLPDQPYQRQAALVQVSRDLWPGLTQVNLRLEVNLGRRSTQGGGVSQGEEEMTIFLCVLCISFSTIWCSACVKWISSKSSLLDSGSQCWFFFLKKGSLWWIKYLRETVGEAKIHYWRGCFRRKTLINGVWGVIKEMSGVKSGWSCPVINLIWRLKYWQRFRLMRIWQRKIKRKQKEHTDIIRTV